MLVFVCQYYCAYDVCRLRATNATNATTNPCWCLFVSIIVLMTCAGYELTNRHGAPLCDFYGCRKHTSLHIVYRGRFCDAHRKVLGMLRSSLMTLKMIPLPQKKTSHWVREYALRSTEQLLRKQPDVHHMAYLRNLECAFAANLSFKDT